MRNKNKGDEKKSGCSYFISDFGLFIFIASPVMLSHYVRKKNTG